MHLGIVVARRTEYVEYLARRRLGVRRPLLDLHHDLIPVAELHSFGVHEDVVGHLARVDPHESMVAGEFHPSHILFVGPADDLGDLPFRVAVALAADDHQLHQVVLQRMIGIPSVDVNVLVEPFHLHIGRPGRHEVHDTLVDGHLRGTQPVLAGQSLHHRSLPEHVVDDLPGTVTALLVVPAAGRGEVLYRILLARKRAEQLRYRRAAVGSTFWREPLRPSFGLLLRHIIS